MTLPFGDDFLKTLWKENAAFELQTIEEDLLTLLPVFYWILRCHFRERDLVF